jgi:hypothetical protein
MKKLTTMSLASVLLTLMLSISAMAGDTPITNLTGDTPITNLTGDTPITNVKVPETGDSTYSASFLAELMKFIKFI